MLFNNTSEGSEFNTMPNPILDTESLGKSPFLHRGLSKHQAKRALQKYGKNVDGVFLIRVNDSDDEEGLLVLSYKAMGRIYHAKIHVLFERLSATQSAFVLSLDYGATKFCDLEQLVQYYQLNAGCLLTRLTHYVVNGPRVPEDYDDEDSDASLF